MEKKFCSFCAEPHVRKQSTCSEECSTELIRVEFQENGNLERSCLWCPVRGDTAAFEFENCCQLCYSARKRIGACERCGGPRGLTHTTSVGNGCPNCSSIEEILKANPLHRAYLLVDESTHRARVFYTSRCDWLKPHRDYATVISVTRKGFERPRWRQWPTPKKFLPTAALKCGSFTEARVKALKVVSKCGPEMTSTKVANLYKKTTGASEDTSLRYFERLKASLRSWGISIKTHQDLTYYYYEVDQAAVNSLLIYFETMLKNKTMGYYWK